MGSGFDPSFTTRVPNGTTGTIVYVQIRSDVLCCKGMIMVEIPLTIKMKDDHDLRDDSAKTIYLYDNIYASQLNATQRGFCLLRD